MLKPKTSGIKQKTIEQRKKATERTTPVVIRTTSKNKLKPTETYESGQQTTPNRNNIQNPTSTPTSSNSSFLNTSLSPLHAGPLDLQTPFYCLEPQTETQQPSTPMDTNQPSTSMGINLLSILNQTLDGAKKKMRALENLQEEQTMRTIPQQQSLQEDGKNLKATLIALAKASHHKPFMETCLTRNQPPKNMKPWIEPHIYRSNTIERKWRDILHNAFLNLVSLTYQPFWIHHPRRNTQTTSTGRRNGKENITQTRRDRNMGNDMPQSPRGSHTTKHETQRRSKKETIIQKKTMDTRGRHGRRLQ